MPGASVTVDLDQARVADSEVVRDLVPHDMANLGREPRGVVAVVTLERAAEDGDLVGQLAAVERRAVPAATFHQRDALIEPEVVRAGRRLGLDDDLDIRDR